MSGLRSLLNCRAGAAAAELALVLPLAILLLFGTVELGYYFYCEHQVVKGVRDGARYASRQSFVGLNCSEGTPSDIPDGVEDAIKEVTRTGQISGGSARIPDWVIGDIEVELTCAGSGSNTGIYENEDEAPQVKIVARVNYPSLFDGLAVLDSTYDLNAEQQAAVMGI